MVYEPLEDSFLLEKAAKKLAKGNVLDIGTGTGIQALAAAKKKAVKTVLATDINKDAINFCKKKSRHNKITYMHSDLFKNVKGKFDTIIFNPPYLPESRGENDIALSGGKKGFELLEKFLIQARAFLKPKGIILTVFSSLTNPNEVNRILEEQLYDWELAGKNHVFFEDLLAYQVTVSKEAEWLDGKISHLEFFARGRRGIVFTGTYQKRKVAVKLKRKSSEAIGRINNEARILKMVNKHRIGPLLRLTADGLIVYDFVQGEYLEDWLDKAGKEKTRKILQQLLMQAYVLDTLKLNKEEFTRPLKNAIVTRDLHLVLIDFERAHHSLKPHNVTQACQFIRNWKKIFDSKGITINLNSLETAAKEYARKMNKDAFEKINKIIS